ncbi:RNA polymerase sigma factor [Polystyrenella longa]|uniref:RNA polymerase sigma factor n=1 Tax=Polystyrenella longa TaxID=2528007 RepID=UPI0021BCF683|nr:sigma-70 family RNA polymerase sigma factor [Polystyrenella longa]
MKEAGQNNDQSWNQLVETYGPFIYQSIRRSGIQSADAADIMQIVLLEVHRSLQSFERQHKGSFRKWLNAVTRNKVIDFCRKRNKLEEITTQQQSDVADSEHKIDQAIPDERQQALVKILQDVKNSVSGKTWQAFEMTEANVETSDQIGRRLGISAAAVRMARRRVLLQIELLYVQHKQKPE